MESGPALCSSPALRLYMSSLGRLHIRPAAEQPAAFPVVDIGYVHLSDGAAEEIQASLAAALKEEEIYFLALERALAVTAATGELPNVLQQVMDHVQHVESVCFYVGDRFLALIDRFGNLVETKRDAGGFLSALPGKSYSEWSKEEILVVAGLHALFLSGRSVRFEEFNGAALTATALWQKLYQLRSMYSLAAPPPDKLPSTDLFQLARSIRSHSVAVDQSGAVRYRQTYGLTFQKTERVLASNCPNEASLTYLDEFGGTYRELIGRSPRSDLSERQFFHEIGMEAAKRDASSFPCLSGSRAATGWIEYLMECVVASALHATTADYAMSSSLRNLSILFEPDEATLIEQIHGLKTSDFFTCFVSSDFAGRLDKQLADAIANSVQRRMMFNRWHFIPGNLDRSNVSSDRHWYYPPVLPDIAAHSDMHRAAHAKAQVKFSIRAPGPDMSRPPLLINGRPYRGFYDVRVVRMEGEEFTTEDMLRVRRRTLWLESIYGAVLSHVRTGCAFLVRGFQPGDYWDVQSCAFPEKRMPPESTARRADEPPTSPHARSANV